MNRPTLWILLTGTIAAALLLLVKHEIDISYVTAPVERGDIINTITVTGLVSPVGEVKVGSQLSGQLAKVLVGFNHEIKKGQPLAQLDATIFKARLREAQSLVEVAETNVLIKEVGILRSESELKNAQEILAIAQLKIDDAYAIHQEAKSDFQRKELLLSSATIPRSQLDEARARHFSSVAKFRAEELKLQVQHLVILKAKLGVRMAKVEVQHAQGIVRQRQAAYDRAKVELERTVIRAPIDGVVIDRNVETGQTVAAALEAPTLFTLAKDLRQIEVKAIIDEADIGKIHKGQRVNFTVAAYARRQFSGQIIEIRKAPKKVENVVTYTVLISTENANQALFPGMTATIWIIVEKAQEVLSVPNAALRFQPPEDIVSHHSSEIKVSSRGASTSTSTIVWVLDKDGKPTPVEISTGAMDDFSTELLNGVLSEEDPVIVRSEKIPGRILFDLPFNW